MSYAHGPETSFISTDNWDLDRVLSVAQSINATHFKLLRTGSTGISDVYVLFLKGDSGWSDTGLDYDSDTDSDMMDSIVVKLFELGLKVDKLMG